MISAVRSTELGDAIAKNISYKAVLYVVDDDVVFRL